MYLRRVGRAYTTLPPAKSILGTRPKIIIIIIIITIVSDAHSRGNVVVVVVHARDVRPTGRPTEGGAEKNK